MVQGKCPNECWKKETLRFRSKKVWVFLKLLVWKNLILNQFMYDTRFTLLCIMNILNIPQKGSNHCRHRSRYISMDVGVLARGQHVAYQAGPRAALSECWCWDADDSICLRSFVVTVIHIWGFPKMVVPPKHPKMIIFSRKTHDCWVPPF